MDELNRRLRLHIGELTVANIAAQLSLEAAGEQLKQRDGRIADLEQQIAEAKAAAAKPSRPTRGGAA